MRRVPPRTKVPMSYHQYVTPPFLLTQMPDGLCLWDIDNLADAVNQFVRYGLPPAEEMGGCLVSDCDGVIAIGYVFNPFAEEKLMWAGVRDAVHVLQCHPLVEPLLMASIEMALEK